MAPHPSAATLWTLNEDTLWRIASFDSKFDTAPSVAIISETPTLCHLSSLNQSLPALLIKRPIPFKKEGSPKATTQSRPAPSAGTNLMNQIQQSFSPFFTSSQPAAPAEPATTTSTTEKYLKPEPALASDPAYTSFTKLIRDTRFYSIALDTSRFLSDEKTLTGDLEKMSERFGDWSRKVEDSVESLGSLHGFESGVMDAFLGGLHLHVLTKLHQR